MTSSGLATDPLVGCVLEGRYRIRARIARGGMSTVYSAVDERLDRLVAVKIMSDSLSADPVFVDRFAREARSAARLTHLNAVAVYDQGQDAGHVFLVMELVKGRTVRDLLHERGRLSPAQAVSLMEPVLGALAAAHRAGLVHRDVKPENILLSDDGVVKVADFGLARAVVQGRASVTATGSMMGTVAYCSPEQITRRSTDPRSDVYSAGIVLFELLTGRPPFVAGSPVEVAYQHVHGMVPAPSELVPGVPPLLDELVCRATSSEPAGRPLDAGAFLAELADVRVDLGLPVVRVPGRPRPGDATTDRPRAERRTAPVSATGDLPTDWIGGAPPGGHSTVVEPAGNSEHRTGALRFAPSTPPPPPAVPGGAGPRSGPARRRRLQRTAVLLAVLLLLGVAAGYGGWWLASGRWAHVPSVTNDSEVAAKAALTDAGLTVAGTDQSEFSETVAKDAVVRTDPAAGARARRGQVVTLFLSRGPERFTVPDVHGMTETAARDALATIPVKITETSQNDDSVPKGSVIATQPAGGTPVKREAAVTVVVSNGPPVIQVPGVSGKSQDDGTAVLKQTGFAVAVQQAFSDTVPAGTVLSQQPDPGQSAVKFSTVTIVVSKGPEFVTLPNVGGKSAEAATAALQSAGVKVTVKKVYGGLLDITVGLDVAPSDRNAAGQVRRGATVVIDVA